MEVDGRLNPGDGDTDTEVGKVTTSREQALPEGDAGQASGSIAGAGGLEEGGGTDRAEGDSATPHRPPGDADVPHSALLGGQRPSEDIDSASQGVREVSESLSPESDGLAPAEELGDSCSDSREEAEGRSERDKSKEDCTLS